MGAGGEEGEIWRGGEGKENGKWEEKWERKREKKEGKRGERGGIDRKAKEEKTQENEAEGRVRKER